MSGDHDKVLDVRKPHFLNRPYKSGLALWTRKKNDSVLHPRHPPDVHLAEVLLRGSLRDQPVDLRGTTVRISGIL